MKTFLIKIVFLFWVVLLQAQFGLQQVISTDALLPVKVTVGDLDGNNTLDVLSAARVGNELAWYSNETGVGDFGTLQLISESSENYANMPGDIDGDGDLDIVASSVFEDIVFWQENLDGLGNFGPQQIIELIDGAFDINLSDIDNDGDLDVLCGSINTDTFYLYKNDGVGNFSESITIGSANARSIVTADIDGDLDLDIVVSTTGNIIVGWYKNLDGLGNFGNLQTIGFINQVTSTINNFPIDIDGDGDIDIFSVSLNDDIGFNWYENLDGLGNFSDRNFISNEENNIWSAFGVDLDNDGDIDVLTASPVDNKVAWFENLDGLGTFGPQQTITTNALSARHVIAADLDNDGDMDVISASQNDSKIAWYENLHSLGVVENQLDSIKLVPNPAQNFLEIYGLKENSFQIKIFTTTGNKVLDSIFYENKIDIGNLAAGVYFVEISAENTSLIKKLVKQ